MALCPECGKPVHGRSSKIYCRRECQEKANSRKQKARRRKTLAAKVMQFNPTKIGSFYESEDERRLRLKRKKLNER